MRLVQLDGPGNVTVSERPDPEAGVGQAVVEIDACGIGGSDRIAFASGSVAAPAWFGHEWTGRIVALGPPSPRPGTAAPFIGQRVVAGVSAPCGHCSQCQSRNTANCSTVLAQIVGSDALADDHGGFATHILAGVERLVAVEEAIETRSAALIEPAAVAVHAIRRSGITIGDVVVVLGTGTVGLLTAELARLSGAALVVSVDILSARRELACDLGADAAFSEVDDGLKKWLADRTAGLGADVVFACVDAADAIAGGLGLVRSGGAIVAVGVGDTINNLAVTALLRREADFRVSLGYVLDDVHRVQHLMSHDQLRVRPLISDRELSLSQVGQGLGPTGPSGPPKILVRPALP